MQVKQEEVEKDRTFFAVVGSGSTLTSTLPPQITHREGRLILREREVAISDCVCLGGQGWSNGTRKFVVFKTNSCSHILTGLHKRL